MHGMDVFMLKNCTTFALDTRKQPYVYKWSLIFFHKLLFVDIKLSDLERRNRKLSAHDCTDHIKTLFSSNNYHETRNIDTSQTAMLLVPGQTVPHYLYQSTKYITYLPYFSWKQHGGLETSQLVLIVAIVEVLLQEASFHF